MSNNAKLIVIDGIDGAGKSTQVVRLSNLLDECHVPNLITHEPQKFKPVGKLIYQYLNEALPDPYTMALLYTADRNEHVRNVILPALESGISVITDRYHTTTMAYQGVHCNIEKLRILGDSFPKPDMVFILDGDVDQFALRQHSQDLFEENLKFQNEVRENYLKFASESGHHIIDGRRIEEEIFKDIRDIFVNEFFGGNLI